MSNEINNTVTVHVDSDSYTGEGRQFADWLETQGHEVRRVENVDGSDELSELWEQYCAA